MSWTMNHMICRIAGVESRMEATFSRYKKRLSKKQHDSLVRDKGFNHQWTYALCTIKTLHLIPDAHSNPKPRTASSSSQTLWKCEPAASYGHLATPAGCQRSWRPARLRAASDRTMKASMMIDWILWPDQLGIHVMQPCFTHGPFINQKKT